MQFASYWRVVCLLGIASACTRSGGALTWQPWEAIDSPLLNPAGELLQGWDGKISLFRMLIESSEPLEDDECGF